ncbi:MAG: VWA domain-containing protein [Nitrospiraceae bacterium]|nr:VWA domain-containing protein [Nitrospiraceae bacterium]
MTHGVLTLVVVLMVGGDTAQFNRIEPIPPAKPIPAETAKVFEKLFAGEIKTALGTAKTIDDGRLAERIFLEAKSRADDPAFVSLALGYVVRLGSISAQHQDLVYAALRSLKRSGLRPSEWCLTQMMCVAPRAIQQMDKATRPYWLSNVWAVDALELAQAQTTRLAFGDALETLAAVSRVAKAGKLPVPEAIRSNREVLAALKAVDDQVGTAGTVTGLHLYKAILSLAKAGDVAQARRHLAASGSAAARELGEAMQALDTQPVSPENALRVRNAVASLSLPSLVQHLLMADITDRCGDAQRRVVEQKFFGISMLGAKTVVFVVDCSSSMSGRIDIAKDELKRSLNGLGAAQEFHVIFFSTITYEMPGTPPFKATAANKQRAMAFVDSISSANGTNPTQALTRAFGLKPDTINLLTDGEFEEGIADRVDNLNVGRKTKVNTVCFVSPQGMPILKRIAKSNRGVFQFVDQQGNAIP